MKRLSISRNPFIIRSIVPSNRGMVDPAPGFSFTAKGLMMTPKMKARGVNPHGFWSVLDHLNKATPRIGKSTIRVMRDRFYREGFIDAGDACNHWLLVMTCGAMTELGDAEVPD
jgi:hypothetical protein